MDDNYIAKYLAEKVDELFTDGFGFNPKDASKLMKHFAFVGNTLYILCFDRPEFVLSFSCNRERISIKMISKLKAIVGGGIIKDICKREYTQCLTQSRKTN